MRKTFTVVDGDSAPPAPPATFDEALTAAVSKARASGAVTFILAWQTDDEVPTAVAFPDAGSVRRGLSMELFNAIHCDGEVVHVE